MKAFLLGLIFFFAHFCDGQLKDCFYVDSGVATLDYPCDPIAEVSI